jgi:hypothetical protein
MQSVPDRGYWQQFFEGRRIDGGTCRQCGEGFAAGDLMQIVTWVSADGPEYLVLFCGRCRFELVPAAALDGRRDTVAVSGRLDEGRHMRGVSVDLLSPPVESALTRRDRHAKER